MDCDFAQARALFEHCLSLPPATRLQWLEREAPSAELARRVTAMLRANDSDLPWLDAGVVAVGLPGMDAGLAIGEAPARLGEFDIVRELGRGGMGAVYLARQQTPQRLVALKRMGVGPSAAARERFRLEADALARLQHPCIAAIHGVGQDDQGEPFLVIEYVDGEALHVHASVLDTDGKLRLLAAIADAVEHAHSRGVIHRDLKPGNVLVASGGRPKVLDFGIARLAAGEDGERAALTEDGTMLGTPAYMSPEQARGEAAQIGPASDIYALGCIGYEMLSGRLPIAVRGMRALEALRAIADDAVPPLSRIVPALRGDIECVFATALARDPAARYASAAAFADDLRRIVDHEPIRARPPSSLQRLRLFSRRNRPLAMSLAFTFLALIAGAVAATWFALGERSERLRAEQALSDARTERERADATLRFLTGLLAEANPANSGRPDVAVRDVLDRALPRLESLSPAARAPLLLVLADSLSAFGAAGRVTPLYERAIALARAHASPQEASAAQARYGAHLIDVGRVREARDALREALEPTAAWADARAHRRALADLGRAEAQLGNESAVARVRAALERIPAVPLQPGEVPPELLLAQEELRMLLEYGDGAALAQRLPGVLEQATALLGETHPYLLSLARYQSEVLYRQHDDVGAMAILARSVERHREVFGEAHVATLRAQAALGQGHAMQGDLRRSLEVNGEARAAARRLLPASSAVHLELLALGVFSRQILNEFDELVEEGGPAWERHCSDALARHEYCGLLAAGLASAHAYADDVAQADLWLQRSIDVLTTRLGPDTPLHALTYANVAHEHALRGRQGEAIRLATLGESMLGKRTDLDPDRYAGVRLILCYAFLVAQRPDLALPLAQAAHDDALSGRDGATPLAPTARALGLSLLRSGRQQEALAVVQRSWDIELTRPLQVQDRTDLARTMVAITSHAAPPGTLDRWVAELRTLVARGGYVPDADTEVRAALQR